MSYSKPNSFYFNLIFCFLFTAFSFAQSDESEVIDSFEEYAEAPREVAYVHLNKSTYIEGEMLGFTAYMFDKVSKARSKLTSNLYCVITNNDGIVLKQKLIKVNDGVASNVFDIDSTLSTGIFTFKAYTNWMRNFDEQNHYEQTFKVINADKANLIKPLNANAVKIDLQVLGEGGHILYNVANSVGIIAKNQYGYGIANANGSIINNKGDLISEFQLNDVGLAKTLFTPLSGESYSVILDVVNNKITKPITEIKQLGMSLKLLSLEDKITISLKTNQKTLESIQNNFRIGLHNGYEILLNNFSLNDNGEKNISFLKEVLQPGVNIFTIFDSKDRPILERIYFNKKGVNKNNLTDLSVNKTKDSLNIELALKNHKIDEFSNLSVSILPSSTKSYNHNNNILSQLYIQPYIKGEVENASKYFLLDDNRTDYNLDLLMMTQGWSSYDWNYIFNYNNNYSHNFEQGIEANININNGEPGSYIINKLKLSDTHLVDNSDNQSNFKISNLFPTDKENLSIRFLPKNNDKGKKTPSIYVQFSPSKFADFTNSYNHITETFIQNDLLFLDTNISEEWNSRGAIQKLDEVIVKGSKKLTRLEELKEKSINSQIRIIDEFDAKYNTPIDQLLRRLGWNAFFNPAGGSLTIFNPRERIFDVATNSLSFGVPLVYLDDFLLNLNVNDQSNFFILTQYQTSLIDYIEYRFYGIGVRGEAGFIKIHTLTRPKFVTDLIEKNNSFEFNLRFDDTKQFYVPKYQYYNTPFFKEYGTIAWQPNVKIDNTGKMTVKIVDTKTENISLFVEGIVNGNQYISQEIKIDTNN